MKEFSFKINGQEYKTTVEEKDGGKAEVTVNGKKYDVELPANAKKATATAAPKAAAAPAANAPAKKLDAVPKTGASELSESIVFFMLAAVFAVGAVVYKKKTV